MGGDPSRARRLAGGYQLGGGSPRARAGRARLLGDARQPAAAASERGKAGARAQAPAKRTRARGPSGSNTLHRARARARKPIGDLRSLEQPATSRVAPMPTANCYICAQSSSGPDRYRASSKSPDEPMASPTVRVPISRPSSRRSLVMRRPAVPGSPRSLGRRRSAGGRRRGNAATMIL